MWLKKFFFIKIFVICCLKIGFGALIPPTNEISIENNFADFLKQNFENLTNQLNAMENKLKILENSLNSKSLLLKSNSQQYDENFNSIKNDMESIDELPTNCETAMKINSWKNSIYLLKIFKSQLPPFYGFCYYETGPGWLIIQRRKDGTENFYRNWLDYKNGFGNLYGEYWLGLERLHELTKNQKYELWILLEDFIGGSKNAYYINFAIESEANNYQLKVDGYSGTAGDSLQYHNGRNFSTYDNINSDSASYNCAERGIGAWWFGNCGHSNLNGPYMSSGDQLTWLGLYWFHYYNTYGKSLRYAHMAIRPVQ